MAIPSAKANQDVVAAYVTFRTFAQNNDSQGRGWSRLSVVEHTQLSSNRQTVDWHCAVRISIHLYVIPLAFIGNPRRVM